MRAKRCGIYMLTNKLTSDRYIGQSVDIQNRYWKHKSDGLKNKHKMPITQAILKYGFENFELSILEECPKGELDKKERMYIAKLKPEYNICVGGRDFGSSGYHPNEKQKELSRQAALRQWQDMDAEKRQEIIKNNLVGPSVGHITLEKAKEQISKSLTGIKQSQETIAKRTAKLKGQKRPGGNLGRKVRCVETNEVFEQIKLAALKNNVSPTSIHGVLSGRQQTSAGYHWEYVS